MKIIAKILAVIFFLLPIPLYVAGWIWIYEYHKDEFSYYFFILLISVVLSYVIQFKLHWYAFGQPYIEGGFDR